jgi:hypothetical protein
MSSISPILPGTICDCRRKRLRAKKTDVNQAMEAHTCNLSYTGGRDQEDSGSKADATDSSYSGASDWSWVIKWRITTQTQGCARQHGVVYFLKRVFKQCRQAGRSMWQSLGFP